LAWEGAYIGGDIGTRASREKWTTSDVPFFGGPPGTPDFNEFNTSAFRGAVHAGYNFQAGVVVIGLEGDYGFSRNHKSVADQPGTFEPYQLNSPDRLKAELAWDASLRARLGIVAAPSVLVYGTGGVAWQHASLSSTCYFGGGWCVANRSESYSKTLTGWTLGAGAEVILSRNWVGRLEYRHADFGRFNATFYANAPIDTYSGAAKVTTDLVTVGLSYKF
jgi:outer membrane immunogenic protein